MPLSSSSFLNLSENEMNKIIALLIFQLQKLHNSNRTSSGQQHLFFPLESIHIHQGINKGNLQRLLWPMIPPVRKELNFFKELTITRAFSLQKIKGFHLFAQHLLYPGIYLAEFSNTHRLFGMTRELL